MRAIVYILTATLFSIISAFADENPQTAKNNYKRPNVANKAKQELKAQEGQTIEVKSQETSANYKNNSAETKVVATTEEFKNEDLVTTNDKSQANYKNQFNTTKKVPVLIPAVEKDHIANVQ
jgi:L-fucose mutarotase/ribose pyranase (RbsD/FucU family)